jgi:hypothetical protein
MRVEEVGTIRHSRHPNEELRMKLARTLVNAAVVAALGLGAGLGAGVASAKPGHGNDIDRPCFPYCENRRDHNDWNDFNHADFDRGPWWANNRHDWWDDRQGPPPWGWGPPPAYQWAGGPPRPFNYWGYDVNPVWDDGFHQWGIWLFGLWIPIFGIGYG